MLIHSRFPKDSQLGIRFPDQKRSGVVLYAALVVAAVLALAAYRYNDMVMSENQASNRLMRMTQARALADSGVYYAAGMLGSSASTGVANSNNLYSDPAIFQNVIVMQSQGSGQSNLQGAFSLINLDFSQQPPLSQPTLTFGMMDESAKINLNAVMQLDPTGNTLYNLLMQLPNMTDPVANSIIDWIDPDETVRNNTGAESQYYSGLTPSYMSKNGPLDSLDELLQIQGITPALLYGTDLNQNGSLDANEQNLTGSYDPGWAQFLTIYSRERNVDINGNQRININNSDLQTLNTQLQSAVGPNLAAYIIAARLYGYSSSGGGGSGSGSGGSSSSSSSGSSSSGSTSSNSSNSGQLINAVQQALSGNSVQGKNNIGSLYSLVNSTVTITAQSSNTGSGSTTGTSSGSTSGSTSPGMTTSSSGNNSTPQSVTYSSPLSDPSQQASLLPLYLDECCISSQIDLPGKINVNTASQQVLAGLPGMTNLLSNIISYRQPPETLQTNSQLYMTPAWMMIQGGLTASQMQQLEPYITGASSIFRVQSVGYFTGTKAPLPMARVEAVLDGNFGTPRILYYRDMTELGQAYPVSFLDGGN